MRPGKEVLVVAFDWNILKVKGSKLCFSRVLDGLGFAFDHFCGNVSVGALKDPVLFEVGSCSS